MIAGLEDITSGDLYIGGRRVNDVLERDRDIAMVFQNYALYPHMTVAQNIAFSLKLAKVGRSTRSASGSRRRRSCSGSSALARPAAEAAVAAASASASRWAARSSASRRRS